jgi:hypothetical protein
VSTWLELAAPAPRVAGADDVRVAARDSALEGSTAPPSSSLKALAAPCAGEKAADEEARQDELDRCWDTATSVPAVEAVAGKELAATRPREAKDVLEVGRRSGERAADGRIEWAAHSGEEQHAADARADLEAAVRDVLVRRPIPCEVEQQAERQGAEPRTEERAAGRAGGDVKGDDQGRDRSSLGLTQAIRARNFTTATAVPTLEKGLRKVRGSRLFSRETWRGHGCPQHARPRMPSGRSLDLTRALGRAPAKACTAERGEHGLDDHEVHQLPVDKLLERHRYKWPGSFAVEPERVPAEC